MLVAEPVPLGAASGRDAARKGERVLTGLCIDGVTAVQPARFLARATATASWRCWRCASKARAQAPDAILDFAGGSSVRLEVGRILCHLDDLGEPWPTRWRPKHPVADAG